MFFKILLFLIISFKNVESNEPFVVLEYKGNMETQEGLNRENMFIKNQNYSIKHSGNIYGDPASYQMAL